MPQIFRIVIALIILSFVFRAFFPILAGIAILFLLFFIIKQIKIMNIPSVNMPKFNTNKKLVYYLIAGIIVILLLIASVRIVPAGTTGVYDLFGKIKDKEVSSGIHLVNPFAQLHKMSIRTEEYTMSIAQGEGRKYGADAITTLTKEGLSVDLDITVLYHLNEDRAAEVYREVGANYEEKIIRPQIRTGIRDIVAQYEAKDIYSEKRAEVTSKILSYLENKINPRGIAVEEVLLRHVSLPPKVAQSIEEKLQAEQDAQRMQFVLEKESQEAERKRIEAKGQRDAQSLINQSLTNKYLEYLYIQNLENREGTIYVPYDLPLFKGL